MTRDSDFLQRAGLPHGQARTARDKSLAMLSTLRHQRTVFAQCLLALAVLAVGLHAALPKGYMLDVDAQTGQLRVVICSGVMGAQERLINLETGEIESADDDQMRADMSSPCAFAAAAAASANLPTDLLPTAPLLSIERQHRRELRIAIHRGDRPTPPARAPPHSV